MSIIVFIIVLSVLVVVHEFGHFIMAKRCGVRVEAFSLGFGPKIVGIRRGDTEYRICAIPLGGYVKMAGENVTDKPTGAKWEFLSKSVGERFKIVISGAFLNYILGFVIFSLVFMIGIPIQQDVNRIGSLMRGYPAAEAGLQAGDAIIAVDGRKTQTWEELVKIIYKKTEGTLQLKVKRDAQILKVDLKPRVEKKFILGGGKEVALIGIRPEHDLQKYSFFQSIKMGGQKLINLTTLTFKVIGGMITGKHSLRELTGPVGIFMITGEMASLGFVYLLNFIGFISASLAIINVLPIPVLDGGHILFLAIEKIRRKPLSFKAQETASQIGLFALITLTIFVFYSDFIKFGIIDKVLGLFK